MDQTRSSVMSKCSQFSSENPGDREARDAGYFLSGRFKTAVTNSLLASQVIQNNPEMRCGVRLGQRVFNHRHIIGFSDTQSPNTRDHHQPGIIVRNIPQHGLSQFAAKTS